MNTSFFKGALVAALTLGSIGLANAQQPSWDTGPGERRGMQEIGQTGEVGAVTLFNRGANATLVVLNLQQPPPHPQPAALQRSHGCERIDPQIAYKLNPVIDGRSTTIVPVSQDRLLSGNYSAVVHANLASPTWYVSCGHLYR